MATKPKGVRKLPGDAGKVRVRRKNLNIDQDKLDRAVELLGVRSETEAVDQALELLILREELVAGIHRIAGTGGVENFFDGEPGA